MENNSYPSSLKNLKKTAIHQSVMFLLILCCFIFFAGEIHAQEQLPLEQSEMEERSLEARTATQEPDFFISGTSAQWIGFYFGVGFRRVKLQVADTVSISDSDGTSNGIGFNLGYFWDEQVVEYERQISIVEHSESFSYLAESGEKLEVIQNNFWYIQYPKINRDLYCTMVQGCSLLKPVLRELTVMMLMKMKSLLQ